jgi:predicted nucleotidyltransferase
MSFDNLYKDWYLAESVLDIPRDGLDPDVFQFPDQGAPVINARIKQQIIDGVGQVHLIVPVQDYYVLGSILTPKYNEHSDIDVNCEVDANINPVALENLVSLLQNINGKLAVGTQHPINFFVVKGEFDHDKTEAIYDIANDRWIKEPDTTPFNARKFMAEYKSKLSDVDLATAELRRDLIDFKELDKLDEDDIANIDFEVKKVLSNIEGEVKSIVDMYDNAKIVRKNAFNKEMTPMEIRKFGHKNNLPDNILYKMLERYFYRDLALKLKPLLADGKITKSEVPKVKKSFKDFLTNV